jgi:hypothetical protein
MKQTYTFRFERPVHQELKLIATNARMTISAYLQAIVQEHLTYLAERRSIDERELGECAPKCGNADTVMVSPATIDDILDQVVEDIPAITEVPQDVQAAPQELESF